MSNTTKRPWHKRYDGLDVLIKMDPAQRPEGWRNMTGSQADDWVDAQEAAGIEIKKGGMYGFHN